MSDLVKEIFLYWQTTLGFEERGLTKERRAKITSRLKTYEVDQLKAVIDFIQTDPWWRGKNPRNCPYDDIVNIFRNDTRVEQLLNQASKQSNKTNTLFKNNTDFESFEF